MIIVLIGVSLIMRILPAKKLLVGMTTGLDLVSDKGLVIKENTILTEKDIKKIKEYFGQEQMVWVYDLAELKQSIYTDTRVAVKYIDYVVSFYRKLLESSMTDSVKFSQLCNCFREYLYRNRSALFDLFILRENHCYTFEHSISVAMYSTLIGIAMGLTDRELYNLVLGGLLHDLGKLKISTVILDKPTKLSDKEFLAIQQHPYYGLLLARNLVDITPEMQQIIAQHHEKLDGTGYPNKLLSQNILYLSKIVTVCDIFDAVTSKRSYHNPISSKKGFEILKNEVDMNHISKEIVDIFYKQMIHYAKNSYVTLNNGELCIVLENVRGNKKPKVISCVTKQVYDLDKINLYIVDGVNKKV